MSETVKDTTLCRALQETANDGVCPAYTFDAMRCFNLIDEDCALSDQGRVILAALSSSRAMAALEDCISYFCMFREKNAPTCWVEAALAATAAPGEPGDGELLEAAEAMNPQTAKLLIGALREARQAVRDYSRTMAQDCDCCRLLEHEDCPCNAGGHENYPPEQTCVAALESHAYLVARTALGLPPTAPDAGEPGAEERDDNAE